MEAIKQIDLNKGMVKLASKDKLAIVESLKAYKKQNPAKYETKKAELFKRYNLDELNQDEVEVEVQDESDIELEKMVTKAKTKKNAK